MTSMVKLYPSTEKILQETESIIAHWQCDKSGMVHMFSSFVIVERKGEGGLATDWSYHMDTLFSFVTLNKL